jgi:hypothetical protein
MSTFYALLTNAGISKITNAQALGQIVHWSHMAVGDGNGSPVTPVATQTALAREKYRGTINSLIVDPNNANQLIAELIIPISVGGWTVREVGIFDTDGVLVAVGNTTEQYKPLLSEGAGSDLIIQMVLALSNSSTVNLQIDPAVILASRAWVTDHFVGKTTTITLTDDLSGSASFVNGNMTLSANLNDTQVLESVKAVDGASSGLDADLLDGFQSAVTATASTIPVRNSSGQLAGDITGNALTATSASKWTTPRTFTLTGNLSGSTTLDGSANVTLNGNFNDAAVLTSIKAVDGAGSGLDADLLDGYETSLGTTASTIPVRNGSGQVVGDITGNSATATMAGKLTTARTITLGGNLTGSASFDGSANITISGNFVDASVLTSVKAVDGTGSGLDADLLDGYESSVAVVANTIPIRTATGKLTSDLIGNADTATKLATARTLAISGAVTGSGSFDGSGNLTIATAHETAFTGSSGSNGYQKFPSGIIIQYGVTGNIAANGQLAVTFPITFPNQMSSVVISPRYVTTPDANEATYEAGSYIRAVATTGFTIQNTDNARNWPAVYYIAIGW